MKCNELFIQALEDEFNESFDAYMSSLEAEYGAEHSFSEKHNKKMQKLIRRQQRPYFNMVSTAGRRAACVAAAIVIVSASMLSIRPIREDVFGLAESERSDHSIITSEGEAGKRRARSTDAESNTGSVSQDNRITEHSDNMIVVKVQYKDQVLFTEIPKTQSVSGAIIPGSVFNPNRSAWITEE